MLNKDYNYKINLRNKFYKKTIDKFVKINKSLELLNKYNKDIYNQLGGSIEDLFIELAAQSRATESSIQKKTSTQTNVSLQVDIAEEIDVMMREVIGYLNEENQATSKKIAETSSAISTFETQLQELSKKNNNNVKIVTGIQELNKNIKQLNDIKSPPVPKLQLKEPLNQTRTAWDETSSILSPRFQQLDSSRSGAESKPGTASSPLSTPLPSPRSDFPALGTEAAQVEAARKAEQRSAKQQGKK